MDITKQSIPTLFNQTLATKESLQALSESYTNAF